MSIEIISLDPAVENDIKYQEPMESYEAEPEVAGTPEKVQYEYYATTQEENFCNWKHQVQQSIKLAKRLLNGKQKVELASKCSAYLENRYNEAYQGRTNIDGIPLVKAELRNNWDQKLFDFIRTNVWKYLTTNINLNDGCFTPNEYNKTSNAIFEAITPDIYGFASKVVKLAPYHTLGY